MMEPSLRAIVLIRFQLLPCVHLRDCLRKIDHDRDAELLTAERKHLRNFGTGSNGAIKYSTALHILQECTFSVVPGVFWQSFYFGGRIPAVELIQITIQTVSFSVLSIAFISGCGEVKSRSSIQTFPHDHAIGCQCSSFV